MLKREVDVIDVTAANVFLLRDGRWRTPPVDHWGVAESAVAGALDAVEARWQPEDILPVDAVFLCNAVRGILPLARLGGRTWPPRPGILHAQWLRAAAHPAHTPEPS